MWKQCVFSLIIGLIFTIFNCKSKVTTTSEKPSPVIILVGEADTNIIEKGIDAVPEGNVIRIEWIPDSEKTIAGYRIYRSEELKRGPYQHITITAPDDSFYLDSGISINRRYFYYIQAENNEGMMSDPSDTLDYKLIAKASDLKVSIRADSFNWIDPNPFLAPFYIIRLLNVSSKEYIWLSQVEPKFDNIQGTPYNHDDGATIDSLTSGVEYQWRVDVVGSEDHCGSESEWMTFQVE